MSYLLDTCVLSEFQRPTPQATVVAWLRAQEEETFFLSVLTLGELQRGISRLPASRKRNRLQAWLDSDLRQRFAGRILPIDDNAALRWGEVHARFEARGTPLPVMDNLIACTTSLEGNPTLGPAKGHRLIIAMAVSHAGDARPLR